MVASWKAVESGAVEVASVSQANNSHMHHNPRLHSTKVPRRDRRHWSFRLRTPLSSYPFIQLPTILIH